MYSPDAGYLFLRENKTQDWLGLETYGKRRKVDEGPRDSPATDQLLPMEGLQGPSPHNGQTEVDTARTRETVGSDSEPENTSDAGPPSLMCPFTTCPDSLLQKTRRGLITHLAAKHVSHGQKVPQAVLTFLKMRQCEDPCKTLVPAGSRCKNCLAGPGGQGAHLEPPGVPVPMLPPPTPSPPRPGSPSEPRY